MSTVATPAPAHASLDRDPVQRRSWRCGTLVFLLYLAPAVFAFRHVWAHPATVAAGGVVDPFQSMWYMQWVPWALGHGHNPLFTVIGNYPLGVNMVAQTSTLTLGLVASPITVLWGPVAAYNVVLTLAFPLAAGAAYLLARRFTTWRPAAFAAGLLYGFSPYMVGQGSSHINLSFVALSPLILLVLHSLFVRQTGSPVGWGLLLAVLVVGQFFISSEILATTAIFAIVALVVIALLNQAEVREHARFALVGLGVGVVVAGIVLAYPLYLLVAGAQHISGAIPGYEAYRSAFAAPLFPSSNMELSTVHLRHLAAGVGGNGVENGSYLGPGVVLAVVAGVAFIRRRVVWVAGVLVLAAFVISLGSPFRLGFPSLAGFASSVPLPATLLGRVPLLQDAYPIRYALHVALFASLIVAVVLDSLRWAGGARGAHRTRGSRLAPGARGSAGARGALLPGVVAVAILVFLLPAWPYPGQARIQIPSYFTTSAVNAIPEGSVAVLYPWPDNTDAQSQLWHAESNMRFRLAGGYFLEPSGPDRAFSYSPVTLVSTVLDQLRTGPPPTETPKLRAGLRGELAGWTVQSIVAAPPTGASVAFFRWLTGRPPSQVTGGVAAWYHLDWRS
jgi:hypothetical protein